MTDATLRIKNLSISLKAISRIKRKGFYSLYDEIEALLGKEIEELQKEQQTRHQPARPAELIPGTYKPPIGFDDIPF